MSSHTTLNTNSMQSRLWVGLLFAIVLGTGAACAAKPKGSSLSQFIHPNDPHIHYIGYFNKKHEFQWSASQIEYIFSGNAVAVHFSAPKGTKVNFRVELNDQVSTLTVDSNNTRYLIANNLDESVVHKLSMFRMSEAEFGVVQFNGFSLSENSKSYEIESNRKKLMVIGDSISCGYANETLNVNEGNSIANQNGYFTYGAITARTIGYDLMLNCWSGRGLFRNRWAGDDKTGVLPDLWGNALPGIDTAKAERLAFVPDVIVVNLGTNDMNTISDTTGKKDKSELDKTEFVQAYHDLIMQLKSFSPKAKVILAIGPMGYEPVSFWLPDIADAYSHVSFHIFSPYQLDADIGGHYHPSKLKHESMAFELSEKVLAVTGSD